MATQGNDWQLGKVIADVALEGRALGSFLLLRHHALMKLSGTLLRTHFLSHDVGSGTRNGRRCYLPRLFDVIPQSLSLPKGMQTLGYNGLGQ